VQHFEAIKFLVPQVFTNNSGMIETGVFVLEVTLKPNVMQSELGLERLHDDGGHVDWVGQERAEEPQGAELHGHAEFGVLVPAGLDDLEVGWLQREVIAELFGVGIAVVLAVSVEVVAGGLFSGWVIGCSVRIFRFYADFPFLG
jgi:hypothetical protein